MTQLIVQIAQMALEILAAQLGGKPVTQSASLLRIIAAAKEAYEAESGQPLDVSKIKPFEELE